MVHRRLAAVVLLAVLWSAAAGSAAAQDEEGLETCERRERREERQKRCVCFPTPELRGLAFWWPGPVGSRARLGVQVSMRRNADTDSIGARIADVVPRSPAAEAGLEDGDIIVSVNGRSLLEPLEDEKLDEDQSAPAQRLVALARRLVAGDTVRVAYRRGRERREATLIARRMEAPEIAVGAFRFPGRVPPGVPGLRWRWEELPFVLEGGRVRVMGIEVVDLNRALGDYFGTDSGVLVTEVDRDSPLPLKPGDVILGVGGRSVEDRDHLRQILRSYRAGETVTLEILRKRARMTVEARGR